jgi:triphosphoribosyl-dephospho-CoA synthase
MHNSAISLLVDSAPQHSNWKLTPTELSKVIGDLAYHSMLVEVNLTPKPGLVDVTSNGSHSDMDITTFEKSADAINPFLAQFVQTGYEHRQEDLSSLLHHLRPIGISCERQMFIATDGINTHKGMIFSLGLVCGVVGWLAGNNRSIYSKTISESIATMTRGLTHNELEQKKSTAVSAGERLYQDHGLTGIRGEAESGYATIMKHGLPSYEDAILTGHSHEQALWQSLLSLMAINSDTNVVARGGLEGLFYVQTYSRRLINQGGSSNDNIEALLVEFDEQLIQRNISPGGSADLLAVTWLIAQINTLQISLLQ